jgi:hypothetical protein
LTGNTLSIEASEPICALASGDLNHCLFWTDLDLLMHEFFLKNLKDLLSRLMTELNFRTLLRPVYKQELVTPEPHVMANRRG